MPSSSTKPSLNSRVTVTHEGESHEAFVIGYKRDEDDGTEKVICAFAEEMEDPQGEQVYGMKIHFCDHESSIPEAQKETATFYAEA